MEASKQDLGPDEKSPPDMLQHGLHRLAHTLLKNTRVNTAKCLP